jgi:hypothetical protein
MSYREEILVSQLLVDVKNPRLPQVQGSQREAIRTMVRTLSGKIIALAEHIVNNGISLGDLPIVMLSEDDPEHYDVLDGNRRLVAIRILETPDLASAALSGSGMKKLKTMSASYKKQPIESMLCVVVDSRKEADPWIQLRHRGEAGGAGLARWDGLQGARYDARVGKVLPQLEVLNFVREHGELDKDVIDRLDSFPITTLERVVKDRDIRHRIGIELSGGEIRTRYPASEVIKPLRRIVRDLALGTRTVSDLKRKAQRLQYAAEIGPDELPDPKTAGTLRPLKDLPPITAPTGTKPATKKGKRGTKGTSERDTLVPSACILSISIERIEDVFNELQKLNVESFRNIAAVMLRVFIEWTIEAYIDREGLRTTLTGDQQRSLHKRLILVLDHLQQTGTMSKAELKPIRVEVNNKDSLMAIETLHAYVHNMGFRPKPSELRGTWDRMEPLLKKIWN